MYPGEHPAAILNSAAAYCWAQWRKIAVGRNDAPLREKWDEADPWAAAACTLERLERRVLAEHPMRPAGLGLEPALFWWQK